MRVKCAVVRAHEMRRPKVENPLHARQELVSSSSRIPDGACLLRRGFLGSHPTVCMPTSPFLSGMQA